MGGFTLVELIVTMVIVVILAAAAIPRFVGRGSFDIRGYADQAQATVRYAQKSAVAKRRNVFVLFGADRVRACYTAACAPGEEVVDPVNGEALRADAPNGVTFDPVPATFSFDGLGRPSLGGPLTITVKLGGEADRSFVVEAETGYVRP